MAPSDLNSGRKREPSLYEVLSITPQTLHGLDPQAAAKTVKQAYRRALLKHHPDKHPQQQQAHPGDGNGAVARAAAAAATTTKTTTTSSSSSSSTFQATTSTTAAASGSSSSEATYTVDQITHAYTVLSDARQRREYTRSLRTPTSATSAARSYEFQTGVETVDLDDLAFDERRGLYHRPCRCGQARGYCFREQDLDDVAEHGELMVECVGCSLWLRVLFEEVTDDEDDDAAAAGPPPAKAPAPARPRTAARPAERTVSSGSHEGKTGRWSWKLSFGISIGGGTGISAKASTS